MNREQKIDYAILKYLEQYKNPMVDNIIATVYKKFKISNFFRIYKIREIEIYNRFNFLIKNDSITGEENETRIRR